jgi:BirA family biotin operon repressor/biotin-[acetyl-CoA-carboxylase] ligase
VRVNLGVVTEDTARTPLTADSLAPLVGGSGWEGRGGCVGGSGPLAALVVTAASPSTNSELLAALAADTEAWPHLSALVTDHQTSGRGRAGRAWETPRGAALTVSFVVMPRWDPERWGLVPLAMGLACVRTLREDGVQAMLKWPNDVVVTIAGDDVPGWGSLRKVAGILCERQGDAVVAGIGINVSQTAQELPVPHAASLAMVGGHQWDRRALLDSLARRLAEVMVEVEQDADAFLTEVQAVTSTLGQQVVVERPGQSPLSGTAVALAADGALVVRVPAGQHVAVHAGDVRLRLE